MDKVEFELINNIKNILHYLITITIHTYSLSQYVVLSLHAFKQFKV
jgi:hypothetical protein